MPFTAFKLHPLLTPMILLLLGGFIFIGFTIGWVSHAETQQTQQFNTLQVQQDQRWCSVFKLLVTAPPSKQPPNKFSTTFHDDLIALYRSFHCTPQ